MSNTVDLKELMGTKYIHYGIISKLSDKLAECLRENKTVDISNVRIVSMCMAKLMQFHTNGLSIYSKDAYTMELLEENKKRVQIKEKDFPYVLEMPKDTKSLTTNIDMLDPTCKYRMDLSIMGSNTRTGYLAYVSIVTMARPEISIFFGSCEIDMLSFAKTLVPHDWQEKNWLTYTGDNIILLSPDNEGKYNLGRGEKVTLDILRSRYLAVPESFGTRKLMKEWPEAKKRLVDIFYSYLNKHDTLSLYSVLNQEEI